MLVAQARVELVKPVAEGGVGLSPVDADAAAEIYDRLLLALEVGEAKMPDVKPTEDDVRTALVASFQNLLQIATLTHMVALLGERRQKDAEELEGVLRRMGEAIEEVRAIARAAAAPGASPSMH
jgi:hypothetical protein